MSEKKETKKYTQEWVDLYNKGLSLREIGKKYDVTYVTVKNRIGDYVDFRPKSLAEQYISEWLELYNSGVKKSEIARMYDVSPSVVGTKLKKAGVPTRPNGLNIDEATIKSVVEEYAKGYSLKSVADKYRISAQTVLKYVNEEGSGSRKLAEVTRKYDIDALYFEELNFEKVFVLGLIYRIAAIVQTHSKTFLRITVVKSRSKLTSYIYDKFNFANENERRDKKDGATRISIYCAEMIDSIKKYGIRTMGDKLEMPKNISPYEDYFIKGYIYGSVSVYKHKVEILGCVDGIKENIISYLVNEFNISKESILDNGKDRIFLTNKKDIEKITKILRDIQKEFSLFSVIKE